MFTKKTVIALLGLTAGAMAAPKAVARDVIDPKLGKAIGGAIDIANGAPVPHLPLEPVQPLPTAAPSLADREDLVARIAAPPQYLTINIVNQRNQPLSTSHASNAGGPAPIKGGGQGTIPVSATGQIVVPTGWAGNVAIIDALAQDGRTVLPESGDNTLIEASFVVASGYTVAVADVDISYVNGFSGAAVCSCSGQVVSGCSKWLWDLNSCPNDNGRGACANPLRASTTVTAPTTFFAPCRGAAYTFPNDNAANSWGACQSGTITCCVGANCPANPRQP